MTMLRTGWICALLAIGLAGCRGLASDPALEEHGIVGGWELVSWRLTGADGEVRHPYGEEPKGMILYTSSGKMSVQLMHPGAGLEDLSGLDAAAAISRVSKTYFAYFGTYTLDEAAGTVTHHVQGCLSPSWVGADRVRAFELLDDGHLSLSATLDEDTNVPGENVLIWRRVR